MALMSRTFISLNLLVTVVLSLTKRSYGAELVLELMTALNKGSVLRCTWPIWCSHLWEKHVLYLYTLPSCIYTATMHRVSLHQSHKLLIQGGYIQLLGWCHWWLYDVQRGKYIYVSILKIKDHLQYYLVVVIRMMFSVSHRVDHHNRLVRRPAPVP